MKISQTPLGASSRIGVDAAVPAVEVADHADAIGVGRPHGEMHAGRSIRRVIAVRAELLERAVVRAFAEQVQIEIGQHAAVAIRVVEFDHVTAGKLDAQTVVGTRRPARTVSNSPGGFRRSIARELAVGQTDVDRSARPAGTRG